MKKEDFSTKYLADDASALGVKKDWMAEQERDKKL